MTVTVLPSRVKSAKVDGDKLSVTFDTALDTNSRPASSAFTVTASKIRLDPHHRRHGCAGRDFGREGDGNAERAGGRGRAADGALRQAGQRQRAEGGCRPQHRAAEFRRPGGDQRRGHDGADVPPIRSCARGFHGATSIIVDFGEALDEGVLKPAAVSAYLYVSVRPVPTSDALRHRSSVVSDFRAISLTVTLATAVTLRRSAVDGESYVGPQDSVSTNPLQDQSGKRGAAGDFGP